MKQRAAQPIVERLLLRAHDRTLYSAAYTRAPHVKRRLWFMF